MTAAEIRKLNEALQLKSMTTTSPEAQDAGLKSLELSLLTEMTAQIAELNETLYNAINNIPIRVQVEPGQWPIQIQQK